MNFAAADARPYALAMAAAALALLFLDRWLDRPREWPEALLSGLAAVLVWRIHLLYWPFYLIYAAYALSRTGRQRIGPTLGLLGGVALAMIPTLISALELAREAPAHAFAPMPGLADLARATRVVWVAAFLLVVLLGRKWLKSRLPIEASTWLLGASWTLLPPLGLFAYSIAAGHSVFVPRYFSLMMPGLVLAGTMACCHLASREFWKPLALVLALAALFPAHEFRSFWPLHASSDWRAAARTVRALGRPALCPSPFLEAVEPVWHPDYPLPGFLYAHLSIYQTDTQSFLLPYRRSPGAEEYAFRLTADPRLGSLGFVVYGQSPQVDDWGRWLLAQPALGGWSMHSGGAFGDVSVAVFTPPFAPAAD